MKNKLKKFIVLVVTLLCTVSCSDYLDVQNKNLLTDDYYENVEGLKQYVIGMFNVYKGMYSYFPTCYFSGLSNEYVFVYTGGEGQSIREWSDLNPKSTNDFAGYLYGSYYNAIRMANIILELSESGKGDIPDANPDEMNRIKGAAYFIRALSHFQLMSFWGKSFDPEDKWGIVIQTKPVVTRADFQIPRSKPSEVYAQIISDFRDAQELLPLEAEVPMELLGYPTRGAATAFLGKMYLTQENYSLAQEEFERFFEENPTKGLLENFEDNFHGLAENGKESVFEIQYSDGVPETGWGGGPGRPYQEFMGPAILGRGNVAVMPSFMYRYEKYDYRKVASAFSSGVDTLYKPDGSFFVNIDSINPTGTGAYLYKAPIGFEFCPKKYINKNRDRLNSKGNCEYSTNENEMIMRVAEVYLMYAEVMAESNLTTAYEYLNKIRRRAFGYGDLPSSPYDLPVVDLQDFFTNLYNEYAKEFIGENLLWFHWHRWGIVEAEVANTDRLYITGTHDAMPIPEGELRTDLLVEQNPGYE